MTQSSEPPVTTEPPATTEPAMPTEPPVATEPPRARPRRSRGRWIALGVLVALAAVVVVLLPGDAQVREWIMAYGLEHDMDITVGDVEISFLESRIELSEVQVRSERSAAVVQVGVETVMISVNWASLWGDSPEIESVDFIRPVARVTLRASERPEGDSEGRSIRAMTIVDGSLTVTRENRSLLSVENLQYQGSDVALLSVPAVLSGADCEAELVVGDTRTSLVLNASGSPQRFTARAVELSVLSALGASAGGARFTGGTLELAVERADSEAPGYAVRAGIRGLRATADPNAGALQRIVVAGMLALIGDGNFDLEFEIPSDDIDSADDISSLLGTVFGRIMRELLSALRR